MSIPNQPYKPPGDGIPATGKILIANPFLKDFNFSRTVVLLCEHSEEGSFGFILNKAFSRKLSDIIPASEVDDMPVYFGGPVQLDTVHFIHNVPGLIEGGFKIKEDIYWGGDFERTVELLNIGLLDREKIKFFIGYSGWGSGQLDNEMKEKSWIITDATAQLLFNNEEAAIWPASLKSMGSNFAMMANYPVDPSLN